MDFAACVQLHCYTVNPGVGVVVRVAVWDPKGPEFKPRWPLELIHTRRLTQPVILPRSVK